MIEAVDPREAQRGFTLVELMIVVAIIALLASIIIPNYVHARAQGSVAETEANMKQIATALELYYADNQAYPQTSGAVTPALFGSATNPYLTVTPTNAVGRHPYQYAYVAASNGKPDSYTVTDSGPYDPTTLQNLQKGPGSSTSCGATGCTEILYDPQDGLYGN